MKIQDEDKQYAAILQKDFLVAVVEELKVISNSILLHKRQHTGFISTALSIN